MLYIRHAQQTHHALDPPIKIPFCPPNFNFDYDIIITSPYLRCRQTAILLNKNNKPIYVDVRISEFQGNKNYKHQFDSNTIPEPPYKETWQEFVLRIDEHYDEISKLSQKVLIVTHGLVVKYLEEKLTGKIKYKRGRDVPNLNGFIISK